MKIRSITLALLLAPALAVAQPSVGTTPGIRSGIIGAGTLNIHHGEFGSYDGILECGVFDRATTVGWLAGYMLDIPFTGSLGLSARLSYWKADGDFTSPNPFAVRVAVDDHTTVPLVTENTLETSIDYVMLDALARWKVAGPLYLAAGPSVGLATRASYQQQERIMSPQGITFQNGESTRKIIAGNFDQQGTVPAKRSLRVAASVALGADIRLSERLALMPEIGYSYGFTNVLSSFDWKVNMIRAGAGLIYSFGDESRPPMPPPGVVPRPVVAFDLHNQLADGTRLNYASITVAEERSTDVIPLLPYLFFAPNSSDLASRYQRLSASAATGFSEEALHDSVLDVYHDLLNIVGARMRAYPDATITVTGCREPLDDAGSNGSLSSARAATVRDYLVSVWNIPADRIRATARVLPATPSYRNVADGREENRRAEISSSDPRILAPVTRRFTERRIDPAAIAVIPDVQFGESIASWRLELNSGAGAVLWRKEGTGAPPADLLWNVGADAVADSGAITAKMEATTVGGETIHAERSIPIRREIRSRRYNGELVRDSLVERYNMIFFDFDTPRISDFNGQVVGLIQSRMRTNSSVSITGLTDRVGEKEHNDALSAERANSVSGRIRSRIVPERVRAEGAGEYLIYDNDFPEGRMYNRTVIIEIATPQE
ncbi:MAG: OmpA family protein [Candidatus Kapaibacterium sp.]